MKYSQFEYNEIRVVFKDGLKYYVIEDLTSYVGYVSRQARRLAKDTGAMKLLLFNHFEEGRQPRRFLSYVISYQDLCDAAERYTRFFGVLTIVERIENMSDSKVEELSAEYMGKVREYSEIYVNARRNNIKKPVICPLSVS